ncbi:Electroneutral sodium bicarbonate exchanger 1 [Seminavis robusta]|uniref:Electroneutral sodium bicarbonate exchanger 1 n=1 Tax=Seminavis robusta TaxID=568900 RepID=A0A9N8E5S7_9STRA|nr:Electroneutral sodium bicarbonate exchanger 1 [Seminavis robusta]|eukprot:Sro692_g188010.1 Electroneutral sodium bicarbonate exchanger 1 (653) ;mRNA; r:12005-14159
MKEEDLEELQMIGRSRSNEERSECSSTRRKREKQDTARTTVDNDDVDSFFHGSNGDDGEEEEAPNEELENLGWGRGVVKDWKRTVGTWWWYEMTNFEQKTIAVTFFMFFAAIAPAITFGAIYEKTTGHYIGAVEMLAATAWVGIVYALIGGSPVMINGGTGPILAFSGVLYKLSGSLDVPFLTLSAWTGLWVMLFNVVAAFVNLNHYILLATRFTDEIFAMLISVIFIINALGNPFAPVGLYYYFDPNHTSHDDYDNESSYSYLSVAMFSVLIAIGTTAFAIFLRGIKFSRFLCNQWSRSTMSDFAVTIAIFCFTALDHFVFSSVHTEKLNVPDTFAPTFACCDTACDSYWPTDCPDLEAPHGRRPWLVDLFDLNGHTYVPFFAAIPAMLAFILVFLDDGITLHLINHPSHKLTHGDAYNLNTLVIGLMVGVNAMLGFPWLVAATVRSLSHLHALAEKTQDGKFQSVLETRLTNLFVHALILGSIFVLPVLKLIPVPVLYGVFLYMGLTSLSTNQFWGRFTMMFMQPSRHPKGLPYTDHVSHKRMHLYTGIQLALFALLYVIKSIKSIAIAFPVVIALCIPIRLYVLPRLFEKQELVFLDSEDDEIEEWIGKIAVGDDTEERSGEDTMLDFIEPEEKQHLEEMVMQEIDDSA